jgi:ABC-2 type transport system ATP-binding protein
MRILLQDFASRGGTVLLSSHLLSEVQATVDRLVVIGGGRIVADGSLAELLAGFGTKVRSLDRAALGAALQAAGLTVSVTAPDGGFVVDAPADQVGRAAAAGLPLVDLRVADGAGLEELFFNLTAGTGLGVRDAARRRPPAPPASVPSRPRGRAVLGGPPVRVSAAAR